MGIRASQSAPSDLGRGPRSSRNPSSRPCRPAHLGIRGTSFARAPTTDIRFVKATRHCRTIDRLSLPDAHIPLQVQRIPSGTVARPIRLWSYPTTSGGDAISGGFVYRGAAVPGLRGKLSSATSRQDALVRRPCGDACCRRRECGTLAEDARAPASAGTIRTIRRTAASSCTPPVAAGRRGWLSLAWRQGPRSARQRRRCPATAAWICASPRIEPGDSIYSPRATG